MGLEEVFFITLTSSALGFGGFGSLPVLRQYLSQAGLAAAGITLQALTVGRLSPGPNGLFLVAVGYFVAGPSGALGALLAVLIPPLAILPISRLRSALDHLPCFRAALRALGIAIIALLIATTVSIVDQVVNSAAAGLTVAAAALLLVLRVRPLLLVAAGFVGFWAMG